MEQARRMEIAKNQYKNLTLIKKISMLFFLNTKCPQKVITNLLRISSQQKQQPKSIFSKDINGSSFNSITNREKGTI